MISFKFISTDPQLGLVGVLAPPLHGRPALLAAVPAAAAVPPGGHIIVLISRLLIYLSRYFVDTLYLDLLTLLTYLVRSNQQGASALGSTLPLGLLVTWVQGWNCSSLTLSAGQLLGLAAATTARAGASSSSAGGMVTVTRLLARAGYLYPAAQVVIADIEHF